MFSAELSADRFKDIEQALASANAALSKVARRLQRALLKPPDVSSESLIKLNSELQSFIALAEPHLLQAVDLLQPLPTELATLLRETLLQCRQWRVQCQDIENDFTCPPGNPERGCWLEFTLPVSRPALAIRVQSTGRAQPVFSFVAPGPISFDCWDCLKPPAPPIALTFPVTPSVHTALHGRQPAPADRQHAQHFSEIAGSSRRSGNPDRGNYWIFTPSFDYLPICKPPWNATSRRYLGGSATPEFA